MSSRESILKSVRQQTLPPRELPSMSGEWLQFDDPCERFAEALRSVGGECFRVADLDEVRVKLESWSAFTTATVRCSTVAGLGNPTVSLDDISDPHDLENVDFAVLAGELAVAENGAVWVTDQQVRHRVLYFITQHLALIVPTKAVVHNMHEAYARLTIGSGQFGVFISGPSKTADIEQSLVIGAHGPRSHVVILVDSL